MFVVSCVVSFCCGLAIRRAQSLSNFYRDVSSALLVASRMSKLQAELVSWPGCTSRYVLFVHFCSFGQRIFTVPSERRDLVLSSLAFRSTLPTVERRGHYIIVEEVIHQAS